MTELERIEEHRDLVAGLEYEDWSERMRGDEEEVESEEERLANVERVRELAGSIGQEVA